MTLRRARWVGVSCCVLALAACSRTPAPQQTAGAQKPVPLPASGPTASRLNAIAEKYWDDYLALHPLTATWLGDHRFDDRFGDYASVSWMADGLAIEQETLEKLAAIDPAKLSADERLTYESLRAGREMAVEGFRYPGELFAVDPVSNLPVRFALLGSGQDAQPFRTAADYDRFLARMDGYVAWVDQAVNNLRSGVAKGVVYPKPVVEQTLRMLRELEVSDARQSLLWQPILNFPAGLTVADRKRLVAAYHDKLTRRVLPADRRLHDYLKNEYLAQARTRPGMDALPSGDLWYAYRVRCYSGAKLTPEEVHQAGLREVARIRADAERLMRQGSAATDLRSFFERLRDEPEPSAAELLASYASAQERVRAGLPLLFAETPRAALRIRATPPLRARFSGTTDYRPPSVDGREPGVLFVSTSRVEPRSAWQVQALYLRDGMPGRHLQAALALEHAGWPRVRRIGDDLVYREGWALYAQSLGRDLGLYDDATSLAGFLAMDLRMAARVVVDTGLHAKHWTREQAVQYLRANTALTETEIDADVDRSLAAPGLLLAPKMGELRIREWRQRAQQRLGARFDVREFHSQVVGGGSMPLPALEKKIDAWLARKN